MSLSLVRFRSISISIFSMIEKVTLKRMFKDPDAPYRGIKGQLYLDGVYLCDTLEPDYLTKYGCVDVGEYDVFLRYSPSFKRKMWYLDMQAVGSKRTGIMFHSGNSAEDTKGCIILGFSDIEKSFYLVCSRFALKAFHYNLQKQNSFKLEIIDYAMPISSEA